MNIPGLILSVCDYCAQWHAGDEEDDEPRWYYCPICGCTE